MKDDFKTLTGKAKDFHDAFRGVPNNILATVLNRCTTGSDWTGCSRYTMAQYLFGGEFSKASPDLDLKAMRKECDLEIEYRKKYAESKKKRDEASVEEQNKTEKQIKAHNEAVLALSNLPTNPILVPAEWVLAQARQLLLIESGSLGRIYTKENKNGTV